MPAEPAGFPAQTALHATGPGRYQGEITTDWNAPVHPLGGLTAAAAARALQTELDRPEMSLRTLHVLFVGRVAAGKVEIDARVLRQGRQMAQVSGELRNEGETSGVSVSAVFGAERDGFAFTDAAMPAVPAPEDCPDLDQSQGEAVSPLLRFPFMDRIPGRMALGVGPWAEVPRTTSATARWHRFAESVALPDGRPDPLAAIVLCDLLVSSVSEWVGPGTSVWLAPSCDLTVHLVGRMTSPWQLVHTRARRAGNGYVSLDLELWDRSGELVACATQVAYFRFPDGYSRDL